MKTKTKMQELTAKALKQELWKTLIAVRTKKLGAKEANSIASQSREILRVVKVEMEIAKASLKKPPQGLLSFNGSDTDVQSKQD